MLFSNQFGLFVITVLLSFGIASTQDVSTPFDYVANANLKAVASASSGTTTTLYKIADGECGQATLAAQYAKAAESFAGLSEGTCAAVGYTVAAGTKELTVPVIGKISVALFKKPAALAAAAGGDTTTLYKIADGECGQATLASQYAKAAESFAGLSEGTCAAVGYTVAAGTKELTVPVIGKISVALFKKPAAASDEDQAVFYKLAPYSEEAECAQATVTAQAAKAYAAVARDLGLHEGTCASVGYTVAAGAKEMTLPLVGAVQFALFRKPSAAAAGAAGGDTTTLYKIADGECGQATLAAQYAKAAESFAGLSEGTCAAVGYTVAAGTKELTVPVIGKISVALFKKPAAVAAAAGGDTTTLCKIADGECGQATLATQYAKAAESFAGLSEGTCAAVGYTVPAGTKELTVPVIGKISVALFKKPADTQGMFDDEQTDADDMQPDAAAIVWKSDKGFGFQMKGGDSSSGVSFSMSVSMGVDLGDDIQDLLLDDGPFAERR